MARAKRHAGKKRITRGPLTIDATPAADKNVLPMRVGAGSLMKNSLLTIDRVAEDVGGREELVNMCRLSEAPEAMEFVRKCEVDGDVALEHILQSMNIRFSEILKSVVPALCEYGGQVSKLMNALKTPEMMKSSIKVAIEDGAFGFADRKMQLEIAGLIQTRAGININLPGSNPGGMERPEATYSGTAVRVDEEDGG